MCGGVIVLPGDLREGHLARRVEQAEREAAREEALQRTVDHGFGQEALLHSRDDRRCVGGHPVAVVSADQVHACLEAGADARLGRGREMKRVLAVDVGGGAAVGHDEALEAPALAQVSIEQRLTRARRNTVDRVVSAHHAARLALDDGRAERRQVGVVQVVRRHLHVFLVAVRLWPAVHRKVLGGRDGLEVPGVVALQALDEGDADARRQVRVFAVGLLSAAPARVAKDVDVGRPDREPSIPLGAAVGLHVLDVLGAKLGGDRVCRFLDQRRVPRGRHADRLREHRRHAGAGDPVQAFVPPVVRGHTQPRNRRGSMTELRGLLFQRHARHERRRALLGRERRVVPLERDVRRRMRRHSSGGGVSRRQPLLPRRQTRPAVRATENRRTRPRTARSLPCKRSRPPAAENIYEPACVDPV